MLHDDGKLCTIEVVIPTINVDPLGHPPSNVSLLLENESLSNVIVMRSTVLADLIHSLRLPPPLRFLAETSFRSDFHPHHLLVSRVRRASSPPSDPRAVSRFGPGCVLKRSRSRTITRDRVTDTLGYNFKR